MPTRNINLTPHYDGFVADQLESGRFQNASEVVRAALSLMEKQNAEDEAKLEALRKEVMIGVEAYERGEYTEINSKEELDQIFAEMRAEVDAEIAAEQAWRLHLNFTPGFPAPLILTRIKSPRVSGWDVALPDQRVRTGIARNG